MSARAPSSARTFHPTFSDTPRSPTSVKDADAAGLHVAERIVTKTLVHSDSLIAAYRGTARSPRAQAFINKALDEMMGVGHEGDHMMPGTSPPGHIHKPSD